MSFGVPLDLPSCRLDKWTARINRSLGNSALDSLCCVVVVPSCHCRSILCASRNKTGFEFVAMDDEDSRTDGTGTKLDGVVVAATGWSTWPWQQGVQRMVDDCIAVLVVHGDLLFVLFVACCSAVLPYATGPVVVTKKVSLPLPLLHFLV